MKILLINWQDPENPLAGGAERVTQAYLEALVERGHEAYWFANAFDGCKPEETLAGIHEGNFARYRIRPSEFEAWTAVWTASGNHSSETTDSSSHA